MKGAIIAGAMSIRTLTSQVRRLLHEGTTAQVTLAWDEAKKQATVEIKYAPTSGHVVGTFDRLGKDLGVVFAGEVSDHPEFAGYGRATANMTHEQRDKLAGLLGLREVL